MKSTTIFDPPPLQKPDYDVSDEWICRRCARLQVTIVTEFPYHRLRVDCALGRYCPVHSCPEFVREPGVD